MDATKNEMDWHLFDPIWKSATAYGESLFFVREAADQPASAPLLFEPTKILDLRSATGDTVYEEGVDFRIDLPSRSLLLTANSHIPWTDRSALYRTADQDQIIDHLSGDESVKLFFGEGYFFHDLQAQVTYTHAESWTGAVPQYQGTTLPRTTEKLSAGQPLTLCMSGDSISAGGNASGFTNVPPHMPPYGELVARGLEQYCDSPITFTNLAVGGMGAAHGVEVANQAANLQPDLMIIAYGMNDVGRRDPQTYRDQIAAGIDIVRRQNRRAEFILVATMLGNPEWVHTPAEPFSEYRDTLASLCTEGIALADMTRMWTDLLRRKRYHDLTGNGVNHPNDFGHRVYAQLLLSLLIDHPGKPT
jgi:acyl-CoA thioesterase I